VTGKATRVNFRPLPLEMILRSNRRDRPLLVGYLLTQLTDAARRLWPEFEPEHNEHKPLTGYPLVPRRAQSQPEGPFRPRWRRYLERDDDDGGV